jgi:hypothetical protein
MIKLFIKLILFVILVSCDSDSPTPFNQNHHRIEFDIVQNNTVKKRVGVSNIIVKDEIDIENTEIIFRLIHKGTISIVSPSCGVSFQEDFDSIYKLNLKKIFKEKKICQYLIIAESKNPNFKKFSLIESGILNVIYKDNQLSDLYMSLENPETLKNYSFTNEGSVQLRSSYRTNEIPINVTTPIEGGYYEITGCSKNLKNKFRSKKFIFYFKSFLKNKLIQISDSCLLNIQIYNLKNEKVSEGFLYVNIFDSKVILNKKLDFKLENNKINVMGNSFEIICSINKSFLLYGCSSKGVYCEDEYIDNKIYWIRGITKLGRKNIYAIKNGRIIWEE